MLILEIGLEMWEILGLETQSSEKMLNCIGALRPWLEKLMRKRMRPKNKFFLKGMRGENYVSAKRDQK